MSLNRFFLMIAVVIVLAGVTIAAALGMGADTNAQGFALVGGMIAVVVIFFASRR